jgi:hypothetical protein
MTSLEITLSITVVLLLGAVAYYWLRARDSGLKRQLRHICTEYKRHLVIPDGLDGYIELDYLLLTSHGLVVLDYRDIQGTIFPGVNLDLWTVLQDKQRFSIQNPFTTMRHRLNAVRALVKDVPVSGVVVFPDEVHFGNEAPENVIKQSQLESRFSDHDVANKEMLIKAFHQPYKNLTSLISAD